MGKWNMKRKKTETSGKYQSFSRGTTQSRVSSSKARINVIFAKGKLIIKAGLICMPATAPALSQSRTENTAAAEDYETDEDIGAVYCCHCVRGCKYLLTIIQREETLRTEIQPHMNGGEREKKETLREIKSRPSPLVPARDLELLPSLRVDPLPVPLLLMQA